MSILRLATYNIHKCRGMDRRVSPERIARVIAETKADIVALQEVVEDKDLHLRHLSDLAKLSFYCFGENRKYRGGGYGNATLSRWPIAGFRNVDLSVRGREPRGMLQADVMLPCGRMLHVLNIHLGTGLVERRRQSRRLLSEDVLLSSKYNAPRIVLGDFNEWTRGLATRLMGKHFRSAETRTTGRIRSYPGVFPVLHLDHVYYDPELRLRDFHLHRSRLALMASDHLPLIADFEVPD